ncbi:hypothetical protein ANANG_G00085570 [Anguilla anguilla]|uniref:Uncharacterized protein n=1 Tax=Anguilla anguilla TaxID=7936 RepID=A0A9D3MQH4_ANGAN|nr:hypothetical protein ANANG_G00085570 [Anguilla anguilla]
MTSTLWCATSAPTGSSSATCPRPGAAPTGSGTAPRSSAQRAEDLTVTAAITTRPGGSAGSTRSTEPEATGAETRSTAISEPKMPSPPTPHLHPSPPSPDPPPLLLPAPTHPLSCSQPLILAPGSQAESYSNLRLGRVPLGLTGTITNTLYTPPPPSFRLSQLLLLIQLRPGLPSPVPGDLLSCRFLLKP